SASSAAGSAPSATSSEAPLPPGTAIANGEGVSPGARTAVIIAGSTLAVGGIVAGAVSLGFSFVKADERQKANLDPLGRDVSNAAARAEANAQSAAIWCFVGGGAALIGTVIFSLATRPQSKAPVTAGAFVGPRGPAIWVEGRF